MVDLRSRIKNISALARELDTNYSYLHCVLKGIREPSVRFAMRIQDAQATGGTIRWTEFFEDPLAQDGIHWP